MGLPSGNRWAVSNLDANGPYYFQETPFQYECSFFSWGNVTPHNPISETAFDYNFGSINSAAPWYEGQPYGDTPGSKLTGDIPLTNDAARRILGSPWRMPNLADIQELLRYCIYINEDGTEVDKTKVDKRVSVNGVLGLYLESIINGARLFISCAGLGINRSLINRTLYGVIWSTTWLSDRDARSLVFYNGVVRTSNYNRYSGYAVRPIWNPRELR